MSGIIEVVFGASLACPRCGRRLVFANGAVILPRYENGEKPLEVLWPSGRCARCGEHIEVPVDVEKHVAASADNPLFILRARSPSGGPVRLFVIRGGEYVYAVEGWPPAEEAYVEEAVLLASGGDKDED